MTCDEDNKENHDDNDNKIAATPDNVCQGEISNLETAVEDANQSNDVSPIKIPPVIHKRGRPKGAELTVIGLPCKRQKATIGSKKKPVPFIKKQPEDKVKGKDKIVCVTTVFEFLSVFRLF